MDLKPKVISITSSENLIHKAAREYDSHPRNAAAKRITDQNFLFEWIKTERDEQVCSTILGQLKEQDKIGYVAMNNRYLLVRHDALRQLTDEEVLADCALNGKFSDIREDAMERISQNAFEEAVLRAPKEIKKKHWKLLLKIRFFGTDAYRTAKKLCASGKVLPTLRDKLAASLEEWSVADTEYQKQHTLCLEYSDELAHTRKSIGELVEMQKKTKNEEIHASYEPLIAELRGRDSSVQEMLDQVLLQLSAIKETKRALFETFNKAVRAAEMYEKHDVVIGNMIAYEKGRQGQLEHLPSD